MIGMSDTTTTSSTVHTTSTDIPQRHGDSHIDRSLSNPDLFNESRLLLRVAFSRTQYPDFTKIRVCHALSFSLGIGNREHIPTLSIAGARQKGRKRLQQGSNRKATVSSCLPKKWKQPPRRKVRKTSVICCDASPVTVACRTWSLWTEGTWCVQVSDSRLRHWERKSISPGICRSLHHEHLSISSPFSSCVCFLNV